MSSPVDPSSLPDPKLPRTKARSRKSGQNEWIAADRAERLKPIVLLVILVAILGVAAVLIVAGLKR